MAPPVISFIGTAEISEGESVTLEIDVNPMAAGQLLEPVVWDIDGDGRFGERVGTSLFDSSSRETLTLSWNKLVDFGLNDDGTFQVGVSATNSEGTSHAFTTIMVNNSAPAVMVRGEDQPLFNLPDVPGDGLIGVPYEIFFTAQDPGDDRVTDWAVVWDEAAFDAGDPSTYEKFGSGTTSATHHYSAPGAYAIQVFAMDEDFDDTVDFSLNGDYSARHQVDIGVASEQVSAGGPYSIVEGGALQLSATAVGDETGAVTGYSWDINGDGLFGDGGITTANGTVSWADLRLLPNTPIDDDGLFDAVTVRVSYLGGVTVDSAPTSLTVANSDPTLALEAVTAIAENDLVTLTGRITDPGEADTFTLNIDWGDTAGPEVVDLANPGTHVVHDVNSGSFSVTHRYLDDNPTGTAQDTYTIGVEVWDDDGGFAADSTQVMVRNEGPVITIDPVAAIDENGIAAVTGTIVDAGIRDTFTLTIDWGEPLQPNNIETIMLAPSATGSQTFSFTHRYLDDDPSATPADSYVIGLLVSDDDGGTDAIDTTVLVRNLAPQLSNLSVTTIDEYGTARLSGEITDAGPSDTFSLLVAWGDGTTEVVNLSAGIASFEVSHQYGDDDPTGTASDSFTIEALLTDDDGGRSSTETTVVTVNNVAPELTGLSFLHSTIAESGVATLVGRFSDVGESDTFTLEIDWGDPSTANNVEIIDLTKASSLDNVTYETDNRLFKVTHHYPDNKANASAADLFTVSATITDDDSGHSATVTVPLTVVNMAPELVSLELDEWAVDENSEVVLTGSFTDAGLLDTHTLQIDWGNPTEAGNVETIDLSQAGSIANVTFDSLTNSFAVTHRYLDDNPSITSRDDYVITATVTDDDGAATLGEVERLVEHTLADTSPARAVIDAARDGDNSLAATSFNLGYDGTSVSVNVAAYSSATTLHDHVQAAIDRQLASLIEAGDIKVSFAANGQLQIAFDHLLDDAQGAVDLIDNARTGTDSISIPSPSILSMTVSASR